MSADAGSNPDGPGIEQASLSAHAASQGRLDAALYSHADLNSDIHSYKTRDSDCYLDGYANQDADDHTRRTATATRTPGSTRAKVVHVHALSATSWAGQTDYWNYVNQDVVNDMVDQGVMALTGTATVAAAWRMLLPDYQPGQGIAIKVNFNNWWRSTSKSMPWYSRSMPLCVG